MTASDSATRPHWTAQPRDPDREQVLVQELGINRLLAAVLVARGYETPDAAARFLRPDQQDLLDPALLPDCQEAVRHVLLAKENDETIYVHGDYDVDGVSSAAIWTRSLRRLGMKVIPHVPHRMKEGYGIHEDAVREAKNQNAKLFLTCDCGSSAIDMVEMARELGMRVVVTDHHELGTRMPEAHAVVNPTRPDSNYPFPYLSGAGVAFKVAEAVAKECGAKPEQFRRAFLDLVCLGTIADVVPLIGENRILATLGLTELAKTKKPGLRALLRVADLSSAAKITSFDVGWKLGPRINASGRVDDAEHALRLLLTDDESEASEQAELLDKHNTERRDEQSRILEQAEEMVVERQLHRKPLIMVWSEGWHPGVIGIVAGKLAEKFYRPTLVASIHCEEGFARGSARSIKEFHLHDALHKHRHLFLSCGGHARAAGFTIEVSRLEEAEEALVSYAGSVLTADDLTPHIVVDIEADVDELDFFSFDALERLQPCGEGNPEPLLAVRGAKLTSVTTTRDGNHVQIAIESRAKLRGIAFDMAEAMSNYSPGDMVDIIFRPRIDPFNGQKRPTMRVCQVLEPRSFL